MIISLSLQPNTIVMSEGFKDLEKKGIANEPSLAEMPLAQLKEVDYTFDNHDFGYPHTLEELDASLDYADAQRHDSSKWLSSIKFHNRLESKHPWLR